MEEIHLRAAQLRWRLVKLQQQNALPIKEELVASSENVLSLLNDSNISNEHAAQKRRANYEINNEALLVENKLLKAKLEAKQQQLSSKMSELSSAREDNKKLRGELEERNQAKENDFNQGRVSDYYLTNIQKELSVLKQQVNVLSVQYDSMSSEYNDLMGTQKDGQRLIQTLQQKQMFLQENLQNAHSEYKTLETRMMRDEHERLSLSASEMILSQKLTEKEDRNTNMTAELVTLQELLTAQMRQVESYQAIISEKEQQNSEHQETIVNLEKACESAIQECRAMLETKENEIALLQARIHELGEQSTTPATSEGKVPSTVLPDVTVASMTDESTTAEAPLHQSSSSLQDTTIQSSAFLDNHEGTGCINCGEQPFGLMIICNVCSREVHSACAKRTGKLDSATQDYTCPACTN